MRVTAMAGRAQTLWEQTGHWRMSLERTSRQKGRRCHGENHAPARALSGPPLRSASPLSSRMPLERVADLGSEPCAERAAHVKGKTWLRVDLGFTRPFPKLAPPPYAPGLFDITGK